VVVGCPKCKSRLNVPDAKLTLEGIKVKCPKCAAVLFVKKPKAPVAAPSAAAAVSSAPAATPPPKAAEKRLDRSMVFVAHENPDVVERMRAVLSSSPYKIISSLDGVDTVVKAKRALPFLFVLDIGLPKINGFEVARRLREAPETKDARIILISHAQDRQRQQKQPAAEYGVDAYIEDSEIEGGLTDVISAVLGERPPKMAAPIMKEAPAQEASTSPAVKPPAEHPPAEPPAPEPPRPSQPSPQAPPVGPAAAPSPSARAVDKEIDRAKRLARTVLSDIDLYSPQKVLEAVKTGSFQSVFADDLKEGLKHYENRIPAAIRSKGNFFQEAIDEFVERKKKLLGM